MALSMPYLQAFSVFPASDYRDEPTTSPSLQVSSPIPRLPSLQAFSVFPASDYREVPTASPSLQVSHLPSLDVPSTGSFQYSETESPPYHHLPCNFFI